MIRILQIIIFTIVFLNGIKGQKTPDAQTILTRVDSAYSKYETIRFFFEIRKSVDNSNDISYESGKIYVEKFDAALMGCKYHCENISRKTVQIFDEDREIRINHKKQTYRILNHRTRSTMFINNGTYIFYFGKDFFKNLIGNPQTKSIELLSDTIIDNLPCYQIKVITDPKIEGYKERKTHYFFQKENYFCKVQKVYINDTGIPRWREDKIIYAEVNKNIDKFRFKYHKNIRTFYKKLPDINYVEPNQLIKIGEEIPEFKAFSLKGEKLTKKSLRGKITLLDFWFIQCPPCVKAMPILDSIALTYKDSGIQVYGMNHLDSKKEIKTFKDSKKSNIESLIIKRKIADKFNVTRYPTFYLIDQNGKVVYSKIGDLKNLFNELSTEIENLLQPEK